MKARWILFLLPLIINSLMASDQLIPIEKKMNNFYKKAFTNIAFYKIHTVDDPLTPGAPNNQIKELFDQNKKRIGFIRDIATTTGCDSLCHPLAFNLVFNEKKQFKTFISRGPLTKKNHIPFSEAETNNLILFLLSKNNYKIPDPSVIVDAITMETKKEYSEGVTKDAALTFYRMLDYKQKTEINLKSLK